MVPALIRGTVLRDTPALLDGREVAVSDFRGRRNIVLIFPGAATVALLEQLSFRSEEIASEEAVVLRASDAVREAYQAPGSAVFIADRYGEIFFSARSPEPLPDAAEVLKWLEFINAQCPE